MKYLRVTSLCVLITCGCDLQDRPKPPGPGHTAPTATTMPTSAPTGPLSPSALMATVNGRPIYMEHLYAPLLEAHGRQIAEILIANAVVAQEADRAKITVTGKDVEAENDRTLQGMLSEGLSPDQRERVLERLLRGRGITRELWTNIMRRNAILRKMASPRVTVSESMLKAEFARLYGQKVQISHIRVPSLTEAEKILQMLKDGKEFTDLARRYSTNTTTAARGGALPPFSREDATIARAIRDTAFSLKEGEISGIVEVESDFHVLKLHKRFVPPRADYEAVKEKLQAELHRRLIGRMQHEILLELLRKAQVKYINPILQRAANLPPVP